MISATLLTLIVVPVLYSLLVARGESVRAPDGIGRPGRPVIGRVTR